MTQNTKAELDARRKALFAKATNQTLITSLVTVEELPRDQETSIMRSWLIDELEQRFPAASELVEQAFADADAEEQATGEMVAVDYVKVLVDAIRATQS